MVEGGVVDTGNSEYLTQGILEIIQGDKALQEKAREFLNQNENLKNLDLAKKEDVISLLNNEKGEGFLTAISQSLSEEEKFKRLAEQTGKNSVMVKKLETLGNQLLVQGVISGAAVTTLTGALAGTLAIGGVAGALVGGGIALLGFLAIAAIAAIGYAIYQHRGEIKEGAIEAGKAVKSFVKNIIDKLPTIQARENNFDRLRSELLAGIADDSKLKAGQSVEDAKNQNKIVEMLRNEEQQSAIQELVKNGTIQNFSEDDMSRLLEKGLSTHESDEKALEELMEKFQPAIMAIGSDIKEVEQKANEKAQEIKPDSQVENPHSEQVSKEEEIKK